MAFIPKNTPINMNDPSDAFSLVSYLNREQYGDRPLFKGPHFDANPIDMKVSDKFTCYICNICNMTCVNIPCNKDYYCKNCNNYLNFTKINIPYSCKLLFQELQSMSIVPRYIV